MRARIMLGRVLPLASVVILTLGTFGPAWAVEFSRSYARAPSAALGPTEADDKPDPPPPPTPSPLPTPDPTPEPSPSPSPEPSPEPSPSPSPEPSESPEPSPEPSPNPPPNHGPATEPSPHPEPDAGTPGGTTAPGVTAGTTSSQLPVKLQDERPPDPDPAIDETPHGYDGRVPTVDVLEDDGSWLNSLSSVLDALGAAGTETSKQPGIAPCRGEACSAVGAGSGTLLVLGSILAAVTGAIAIGASTRRRTRGRLVRDAGRSTAAP